MHWKLILKDRKTQPISGEYQDWKEQIASECFNQCVYCSIHEEQFGGIDHYQIDHFRPKSRVEFEKLKNDIMNLFYACPICNRFKSDDWPGEPESLDVVCYPDPSLTDYATIFSMSSNSYILAGKYISSTYVVERLYLNRPQLVYERREKFLKNREALLTSEVNDLVQQTDEIVLLKAAHALANKIRQHLAKREKIRPYTLSEIRRTSDDIKQNTRPLRKLTPKKIKRKGVDKKKGL